MLYGGNRQRRFQTPHSLLIDSGTSARRSGRRGRDAGKGRPIRVLLVDAHQLLARSLAVILGSDPALEVLGTVVNLEEALAEIRLVQPDVILISYFIVQSADERLPAMLRTEFPDVKLLVLVVTPDAASVSKCINAGAVGCVSRDQPPEELLNSIRRAHAGELIFPPQALREVLADVQARRQPLTRVPPPIGRREREVLQALATGGSIEQTADRLSISAHTVRTHLKHAMAKLDVHSRLEAVLVAHRLGLIELSE
jgi:DNA-binding NarL/FixJ family response regulator